MAAHPTQTGVITGTILYMFPEQASAQPVDERSDIFSFGIVLYELLAGCPPFSGATLVEQVDALFHQAPAGLSGDIPQSLRLVVEKALAKDPAERYQSMREMVVDLRRLLGQQPDPPQGTKRWQLAAASLAVAFLAIGIAWWMRQDGRSVSAVPKSITFSQLTDLPTIPPADLLEILPCIARTLTYGLSG